MFCARVQLTVRSWRISIPLKSNEMAECSSVKSRRRSRILAYAHGSSPYTGKVSVWRCIINEWTRLDQVTMLS